MPRPKRADPKVRLNLELSEPTRDRLERLRVATEADSMTEVIRRALSLYEMVLTASNEGAQTIRRDADGTERNLLVL